MSTRRDERFPVNQRATVHDAAHDVHLQVFVRDISAGGLFISTDHRFDRGLQVEVELLLAGGETLLLPGTVVHAISREQAAQWGRPFGVGVQFTPLDRTGAARLDGYLRTVMQRLTDELRAAPFETSLLTQLEHGHRLGDLYTVLGLEPTADGEQIREALQGRSDVLNGLLVTEGLSDALRKRVIAARLATQRAGAILGDERTRAVYLSRVLAMASAAATGSARDGETLA
jgi:Tfp pilus assembly protein PilZ